MSTYHKTLYTPLLRGDTESALKGYEFALKEAEKEMGHLIHLEATVPKEYQPSIIRQIKSLKKEISGYEKVIDGLKKEEDNK